MLFRGFTVDSCHKCIYICLKVELDSVLYHMLKFALEFCGDAQKIVEN